MQTRWKNYPRIFTDDNLNNIGEGICRVRAKYDAVPFAKIKGSYKRGEQRWLVIIDGLTVASCGQPGEALATCDAHLMDPTLLEGLKA